MSLLHEPTAPLGRHALTKPAHRAAHGHLMLVDAVNLLPLLQTQLVVAQQPAVEKELESPRSPLGFSALPQPRSSAHLLGSAYSVDLVRPPQFIAAQQRAAPRAQPCCTALVAYAVTPRRCAVPLHTVQQAQLLRNHGPCCKLAQQAPPHLMRIVHCSSSSSAYRRARCAARRGGSWKK